MKCALFVLIFLLFFFKPFLVFAIENPISIPNNKFGVHILFTSELNSASNLINSTNGDWGYVTIPIQVNDRDLEKWQGFMDSARKNHVIPIIRLATEGDYFNTSFWRRPTEEDVLDFANFLNSLGWPVKNRYVIVFNEVNRGDEWGGIPNPQEYARILSYAAEIFKSLSPDFFIISAGLDNASENNQYNFMIQMNQNVPGIFNKIDGLGSHSYPNPGFSQPPWLITNKNISSFKFERNLAVELSDKDLPVFITETGWSRDRLSENQIGQYFNYAFDSVWSDKNVVAVTPFLLLAGTVPFSQFSILSENGDYNALAHALQKIPKVQGKPTINIVSSSNLSPNNNNTFFKIFPKDNQYESLSIERAQAIKPFLKWLLKL